MMGKTDSSVNAGVHASTGFEFQKHCALYLFLEDYHNLKNKDFYICIEHHDDFLYCFLDKNNFISQIKLFQAKKSGSEWGMQDELFGLLSKILIAGVALDNDSAPKLISYTQHLNFITNNNINLSALVKDPTTSKNKRITKKINESNSTLSFLKIDSRIKREIITKVKDKSSDLEQIRKFKNLKLLYIDLGKRSLSQLDQIKGQFNRVFGNTVADHSAAVDTLLLLFKKVETVFNQGNKSKLLDESKRVTSGDISKAINIITTKQKAYKVWRSYKNTLPKALKIPVSRQSEFVQEFENSFDLFKDISQSEHQKIYRFVFNNKNLMDQCYDDENCILMFINEFNKKHSSSLDNLRINAAIFAAYIELKG